MDAERIQTELTNARRELVGSRLDVLRFDPAFHGALAMSTMGDLTSLWRGLRKDERQSLKDFARDHRRIRHLEIRGETEKLAALCDEVSEAHPMFRAVIEESAARIKREMNEDETA